MKKNIPQDINKLSFIQSVTLLNRNEIPYIPFYGTLLGIVRDNNMIDGDDDVDFLINKKYYNTVRDLFGDNGYNITTNDLQEVFTQFTTIIDGVEVLIDCYYFEDIIGGDVLDKWGFYGQPNNKELHIHIPKDLIFPIQSKQFENVKINFPLKPNDLCKFLYGERYGKKMVKNVDYSHNIVNNKPQISFLKN